MFKINLNSVLCEEDIDWEKIISLTDGYSGADIANVCREAALMQMRRRLLNNSTDILNLISDPSFEQQLSAPISQIDLEDSIKNISKSVSNNDLKAYEKWSDEFKST